MPSPVYVETAHAFYALQSPSKDYKPFFQAFYKPHRVAQVVLTMATIFPNLKREGFLRKMAVAPRDHLLQQKITEDDIEDAVCPYVLALPCF
jgi:DNA (cytosine-5)-methyltransferase 1